MKTEQETALYGTGRRTCFRARGLACPAANTDPPPLAARFAAFLPPALTGLLFVLYWMIPAVLASLVGGVINAWLFLLKVPARTSDLP